MQFNKLIHNIVGVFTLFLAITSVKATNITGAGASFPAPVYSQWAADYQKETGARVNYQSIGSSGGVKQINAKTVDFGATDEPVAENILKQNGFFQFPTVIGGVVLAVNINGVKSGDLVLDGQVIGDIFLGKITKWNDPAIQKLNPQLSLPKQSIQAVFRSDGSGTSYVFTSYLAKVNSSWAGKANKSFPEPQDGYSAGAKGNEGVAATIQRQRGSIGYVEYAYIKQSKLSYVKLLSADGEIVSPSIESFSNASNQIDWNESFAQDLTYQKGKNTWPITSTTFILINKQAESVEKTKTIIDFFTWGFSSKGRDRAKQLDYVVLPEPVIEIIKNAWKTQVTDQNGKAIY